MALPLVRRVSGLSDHSARLTPSLRSSTDLPLFQSSASLATTPFGYELPSPEQRDTSLIAQLKLSLTKEATYWVHLSSSPAALQPASMNALQVAAPSCRTAPPVPRKPSSGSPYTG